nr:VENN motif pre-toxin domain-containing protein [Pantoea sp. M_9]
MTGGSLTQAVTGAAAPYLAEVIHNQTLNADGSVIVQANLMAHAVVGAVTAYAAGNSALSGASGAAMGEYIAQQMYPGTDRSDLTETQRQTISALAMGEYIAQQMYPGTDRSDLTETQRQTISALGTLAAGLAGGVAGDSTAGAVAGAQTGRNAVENNNLSGLDGFGSGFWNNVQAQGSLVNNTNLTVETGKVLNPASPEQIKYASDKLVTGDLPVGQNAATGLLTAWGAGATTIVAPVLLPATATAGSVIGAGAIGGSANVFNQLNSGGPFSATDALIATGISGVTQGKGFWFTEAASITGAYAGAKLQGKDTLPAVVGAGFGTAVGAAGGKALEVGNKYFPLVSDKTAGMAGAIGGSVASEITGSKTESKLKEAGDNK